MIPMTAQLLEEQLDAVKELESRLTFRLSLLSRQADHEATELLHDVPISLAAYRVLSVVDTFKEMSLSDISRFNGIDRAQVTRSAASLEKQGLIEFRADAHSKRKKLVVLSERGKELLEKVKPRFAERRKALEAAMGEEDLEHLWIGLKKLATVLNDRS